MARCATCFYHDRLNDGGGSTDLTRSELETLAASLPPLRDLWLSGGEPLLREDLIEVCEAFARHCGVETIDLPVNGLFYAIGASHGGKNIYILNPLFRPRAGYRTCAKPTADRSGRLHHYCARNHTNFC